MPAADAPMSAPARLRARLHPRLTAGGAAVQATVAAAVSRPLTWVLFVGLMFGLPLGKSVTRTLPLPPPVLGQVPPFALVTDKGETWHADRFRGRVWVAGFMTLDRLAQDNRHTALLGQIQHRFRNMGDSAQILSISIAPATDTPARLMAYAQAQHANPFIWHFVSGPTADLHETLSTQAREHRPELIEGVSLADSGYFVLVDPDLRVRGFYPPTPEGLDALVLDCALVANLYIPAAAPEGTPS